MHVNIEQNQSLSNFIQLNKSLKHSPCSVEICLLVDFLLTGRNLLAGGFPPDRPKFACWWISSCRHAEICLLVDFLLQTCRNLLAGGFPPDRPKFACWWISSWQAEICLLVDILLTGRNLLAGGYPPDRPKFYHSRNSWQVHSLAVAKAMRV